MWYSVGDTLNIYIAIANAIAIAIAIEHAKFLLHEKWNDFPRILTRPAAPFEHFNTKRTEKLIKYDPKKSNICIFLKFYESLHSK